MRRRFLIFASLGVMAVALVGGIASGAAQPAATEPSGVSAKVLKDRADAVKEKKAKRVTQPQREQAAARAAAEGLTLATAETAQVAAPGEAPHYFSVPNYANSPLPTVEGTVISVGNPLVAERVAPAGQSRV